MMCRLPFALAVLAAVAACGGITDLTGQWKLDEPEQAALSAGGEQLHLRLVLGHYDREFAGMVLFYDANMEQHAQCPCVVIQDGKYSGGWATFRFKFCGQDAYVDAQLQFNDSRDRLTGTLTVKESEGQTPLEHQVVFQKDKEVVEYKSCGN